MSYDKTPLMAMIPEEFWRGDDKPKVATVGELIAALKYVPSDMRLTEPMQVTVYNISRPELACVGVSEF